MQETPNKDNPGCWHLLHKTAGPGPGQVARTEVMEIGVEFEHESLHTVNGCLIQVTTQQNGYATKALIYIKNVKVSKCGLKLVSTY